MGSVQHKRQQTRRYPMATATKNPAKKAAAKAKAEPKAKTPKALVPCKCNTTQVGEQNGTPVYGPCGSETRRDFAPGHDARLKGVLIKLHVAGQDYLVKGQAARKPMDVARERQWGGYLTAAAERETRRAKAKEGRDAAAAERKAEAAKVKAVRDAEKAAAAKAKAAEKAATKAAA